MIDKILSVFGEFNSVGLMVIISSIIVAYLNHFLKKNEEENKLGKGWKCKTRKSFQTKYIIFFVSLFILAVLLTIIVDILLSLLFNISDEELGFRLVYLISSFLELIIGICFIITFNHETKIRKIRDKINNKFQNKVKLLENIIYIFVVLIPISMLLICGFNVQGFMNKSYLFAIVAVILELVGVIVFDDKLNYQFKTATLYLNDNEKYERVEVRSIGKKGKWIFLETGGKEVRILQDKLYKIEYFDKQF